MSSFEDDSASSFNSLLKEKKFVIETDKKNKMDLFLRINNYDDFAISIYSKNEKPARNYEIKFTLEEIQKNRFFKMFINVEEIMEELEDKIKKSIFIEENDSINIEIPIGLVVIKCLNLTIGLTKKAKQRINEKLKNKIEEQNEEIEKLKIQNNKLNNNLNLINETIKKLKEENNQLKKNNEIIKKEKISKKIF